MHKIQLKPLSANELWRGRRFPTETYKSYRKKLMIILPNICPFPEPPYRVDYEFGVSNAKSDYDNCIKGFQDALQERYGFDDKHIMEAHIHKIIVPRGDEYISFDIYTIEGITATHTNPTALKYINGFKNK